MVISIMGRYLYSLENLETPQPILTLPSQLPPPSLPEITPSTIGLANTRGFGWSVKSGENVDQVGGDDLLVGSALFYLVAPSRGSCKGDCATKVVTTPVFQFRYCSVVEIGTRAKDKTKNYPKTYTT
eukprot:sb/3475505/